MLVKSIDRKKIAKWKYLSKKYGGTLVPDRKSGRDLLKYLQEKYVLEEIKDVKALEVVCGNVTENEVFSEKLPLGALPDPVAFYIKNQGAGKILYENKGEGEEVFADSEKIFVGIDLKTGYFTVEGSILLRNELFFRGLDKKDLQNFALVGQYLELTK